MGTIGSRPLSDGAESGDYLTWHRTVVAGRRAVYGVGGADGPPVVFLHGWALGSRAYKRAIRRLTSRGCRVFAPALPSFGGSADLPSGEMNIGGYADWVASFMSEVGIDEPALVIGHSFGGGVAIKLARSHPALVRYLVLLNAIGSGDARRPWEWAMGFGREFWPLSDSLELMQAMRADLVPNVLRNPVGLARAGLVAQRADLRVELAELKKSGVPVLALTGDRDRVIPRSAFEAVCNTVGADRRVVSGGHAWLLVDPDSFGEVLASTIDVQVAEHEASRAADRRSEVERLLRGTKLSKRDIKSLLGSAAPLWLLSDTALALAGDLVLCRPKLKKGEVRALARRIEASTLVRLTIVARDRRGLLADSAAVLTTSGMCISNASASTWKQQHLALHSFIVGGGAQFDRAAWDRLGERLRTMVATDTAPLAGLRPLGRATVTVQGADDRSIVKVVAPDEQGLLATICRYFQVHDVDIETLQARTRNGMANDTFLVIGTVDAEDLKAELEHPPDPVGARDLELATGAKILAAEN
ncbi:MAG TPA: alpha/beta fold hydrolase [Acidimicrobiales bacterium]|nr:alpha/beta fold hydrolase [Acidimicrobiales bacterium]